MNFLNRRNAFIIMVAAVCIANINVVKNDFVFDDLEIIQFNPRIRSLSNIPNLFLTPYWGEGSTSNLYRPVTLASYSLQYSISKLNPFLYHVANVLLHLANALLFWLLLLRLTKNEKLSFAASMLFALHPIHVEAVAQVVGRAELLVTLCSLSSCLLFLRRSEFKRKWLADVFIVLCFFIGLGCKENAIIIPVLLCLLHWLCPCKDRINGEFKRHAMLIALLLFVFVFYFSLRAAAIDGEFFSVRKEHHFTNNPLVILPFFQRVLMVLRISGLYLFNLCFPVQLNPDYSYNQIPLNISWFDWDLYLLVAFLFLAGWWIFKQREQRNAVLFFAGLGLTAYFPVSNLAIRIGTIMGNRLMYLPSLAFCFLLAVFIFELCVKIKNKNLILPVCITIACIYGGLNLYYNNIWRSQLSLFSYGVKVSPRSFRTHYILGLSYKNSKPPDYKKAEQSFMRALKIVPEDFLVLGQLGLCSMHYGHDRQALRYFQQAAMNMERMKRNDWPGIYFYLGECYQRLGLNDEALLAYEENLKREPQKATRAKRKIKQLK